MSALDFSAAIAENAGMDVEDVKNNLRQLVSVYRTKADELELLIGSMEDAERIARNGWGDKLSEDTVSRLSHGPPKRELPKLTTRPIRGSLYAAMCRFVEGRQAAFSNKDIVDWLEGPLGVGGEVAGDAVNAGLRRLEAENRITVETRPMGRRAGVYHPAYRSPVPEETE